MEERRHDRQMDNEILERRFDVRKNIEELLPRALGKNIGVDAISEFLNKQNVGYKNRYLVEEAFHEFKRGSISILPMKQTSELGISSEQLRPSEQKYVASYSEIIIGDMGNEPVYVIYYIFGSSKFAKLDVSKYSPFNTEKEAAAEEILSAFAHIGRNLVLTEKDGLS